MKEKAFWLGFAVGCLVGIAAVILGVSTAKDYWQTQCVQRGAAEWVIEDDGTTKFKWLLEPQVKP